MDFFQHPVYLGMRYGPGSVGETAESIVGMFVHEHSRSSKRLFNRLSTVPPQLLKKVYDARKEAHAQALSVYGVTDDNFNLTSFDVFRITTQSCFALQVFGLMCLDSKAFYNEILADDDAYIIACLIIFMIAYEANARIVKTDPDSFSSKCKVLHQSLVNTVLFRRQ